MKLNKQTTIILASILILSMTGCKSTSNTIKSTSESNSVSQTTLEVSTRVSKKTSEATSTANGNNESSNEVSESTVTNTTASITTQTTEIVATEASGTFNITTSDGNYSVSDNIYTIKSAGTYTLSGYLEGQILVEASEQDDVVLELNGVTINYSKDSPIKVLSADSVEISAKKNTENVINDTRSTKTVDSDTQGEGAISAKCDLKIKGNGTLVVTGNYNNGIHTTKDLTIQNLTLKVTAYNNAVKGKDSITVKSGTIVAISTNGDGFKTENTDANKNGETRGDIVFLGGDITIYAAGDGISAAHNYSMEADSDGNVANVSIYTGSYSSYTASNNSSTSYKGIKAQNELNISAGTLYIKSYDDALHADNGTVFETGATGVGTVNITGGDVTVEVATQTSQTSASTTTQVQGRGGRGGFNGGMAAVSGSDGIHADNILSISGGTVNVVNAYEGLEATYINISGGNTYVYATDDGLNASKKVANSPQINISGGYLDVTVSPNGDTDGIDSNGTYNQTGGVVIARGANSAQQGALDTDGSQTITGGTLIVLGYCKVTAGGNVKSYSLSLNSAGTHTVNIGGTSYTFTNSSSYSSTKVYSSVAVTQ